ncbi:lytic polysaccharide monooxygenase [Paenibacillus methanolicus]|uniref:Chitin-binding protein n=1 Tax=Paenibacillus methanolicus TaxID=582686 RepID=A0A5S5CH14_9BACL|nr:lytic polysaccharide monooxygenase [Paenibacillus methanolicus]TYP79076.1 chitin-binding protein [Paenibacillus methanolicus]
MNQVRLNTVLTKRLLIACGGLMFAIALSFLLAQSASAHGYVDSPASRAIQCKNGLNANCGPIIYEPQSLEGLKGFPAAGPADGKIASAGLAGFATLDQQSATRWNKASMSSGPNTFTWKFTARHATTSYRYFITKENWNPNAPLTRDQLNLTPFCTVNGNSQQPPATLSHSCNVPARTGYHIILAVWDIADTGNAWYNAIDVQFGASDNVAPTAPSGLNATAVGATTATLTWGASTDNVAVSGYEVYAGANATPIATVPGNQISVNVTNLAAGTTHTLTVKAYDAAGNRSPASNAVMVTTDPLPVDSTPPTAPSGLHVMGAAGSNSLTLMWSASSDASGIAEYRIYAGSALIDTVSGGSYEKLVAGLTPNTSYTFTVRAYDPSNNESAASNAVTVTTAQGPSATPWTANAAYATGALVSYNGAVYKCLQAHTSLTGWEPSNVPALWQLQP